MTADEPSGTQPAQSPKKTDQLVYLFNMSEDVWPFIQAISDPKAREFEINENANFSDREIYSVAKEPGAIFISPKAINPEFFEYFTNLTKAKIQVLTPTLHTGELSRDCVTNPEIFTKLVEIGKKAQRLVMVPYSTTFQFLELVSALSSEGIQVYTPESPSEEYAWTVNFFGSKSGIRQLVQKSAAVEPDLKMSDGLICVSTIDAARIAASKYLKEKGVFIKTNKGHSGAGVLIFREGELPMTYKACEQAILDVLRKDAYWEMFPIVIESLVNVNTSIGGGLPNVEFKIKKSGEIEFLYFCGLRATKDGVFHGVEINVDVISDRIQARLIDTGFYLGEQYAAAGYRGFFDMDFIVGKNNDIYLSESNVRRTGGTFSYEAMSLLIGEDFMKDSYMLMDMSYKLASTPSFGEVLAVLEPVLFDKGTKEGLVLASANLLHQKQLAYMIFGKNKKRAIAVEDTMKELLQSAGYWSFIRDLPLSKV